MCPTLSVAKDLDDRVAVLSVDTPAECFQTVPLSVERELLAVLIGADPRVKGDTAHARLSVVQVGHKPVIALVRCQFKTSPFPAWPPLGSFQLPRRIEDLIGREPDLFDEPVTSTPERTLEGASLIESGAKRSLPPSST